MSTNLDNHENSGSHGGYEHQDVGVVGILYALIGLAVFCLVVHFLVTGLYGVLERFADTDKSPMSPLIADVPTDVRHIPEDYPKNVFPDPRLEKYEDERGEFWPMLRSQEETLNSYGWVNQPAGVARIPVDRAIDLLAQRGLPVHSEAAASAAPVTARKAAKR